MQLSSVKKQRTAQKQIFSIGSLNIKTITDLNQEPKAGTLHNKFHGSMHILDCSTL